MEFKSFIETQFPVSKVSKESYKERKAVSGQTLTGLGRWWGRKPLILVRAAILGILMPASDNPVKDREVFLKILTMDQEGLWLRKSKNIPLRELYNRLNAKEREEWLDSNSTPERPQYKQGISSEDKKKLQRIVFERLSYDEKLVYCERPEQINGPNKSTWKEINQHLGTTAFSLQELVEQLGQKQFGNIPHLGDAFCGGGSVPFEGARIGCEVYSSDLNPVAALLTWADLNIIGGKPESVEQVHKVQMDIYKAVDRQVTAWGIEHNELGWRADAYLYCNEVICPECGWKVPLAPSWVIAEKTSCIAKLQPDENNQSFNILIENEVSREELNAAKDAGTVKNSSLVCPHCNISTPITMLRGDRRIGDETQYGLRLWDSHDIVPRPDDVFQERLYCIRWVEEYIDENGDLKIRRHYCSPNDDNLEREERVLSLLVERFADWQEKGYIPSRRIEPGDETTRLMRERGWTHWHHLFNPRQLLICGLFNAYREEFDSKESTLLLIGRVANNNSRLSRWKPSQSGGIGGVIDTFSNQALNTLYNYGCRPVIAHQTLIMDLVAQEFVNTRPHEVNVCDCRNVSRIQNYWITDPPYADAINYHELSEFFLAWYEKHIPKLFPNWYTDSKRALAIKGVDESFRKNMVECYRNLAQNMTDNGAQIVMFTHQDAAVWADLALILWAAGLRVTSAWCLVTETDTAMREGNYVQGTVLLVLRKQTSNKTAFLDELYPQVEEEVRAQLDSMLALDDKEDPNFGDTDYQLAAYAAALRVLTRYRNIEDIDVARELSRPRQRGEKTPIEAIIEEAVKIACDHLVPQGFDSFIWKSLKPEERFYIKGLEMESHGEYRSGAYQELARGFGIREYRGLLAGTRANQTRLKTASEFASRMLDDTGFGVSLVRHILFAIRECVRSGETVDGRNWFRNELKDQYWNQRQTIIKILNYLASLGMNKNMPHWELDANAARLLAGAVENDHI